MIQIEVAYATPAEQKILTLEVASGTTVHQAIEQSGIYQHFPEINLDDYQAGVWNKLEKKPAERVLVNGDRIEIYRPLLIDPKQARLNRAAKNKKAEQ